MTNYRALRTALQSQLEKLEFSIHGMDNSRIIDQRVALRERSIEGDDDRQAAQETGWMYRVRRDINKGWAAVTWQVLLDRISDAERLRKKIHDARTNIQATERDLASLRDEKYKILERIALKTQEQLRLCDAGEETRSPVYIQKMLKLEMEKRNLFVLSAQLNIQIRSVEEIIARSMQSIRISEQELLNKLSQVSRDKNRWGL